MKMLRTALFLAAAAAALASFALPSAPAQAANAILCSPMGDNMGSRRITNPNTNVSYTLDGRGCGLIAIADLGYFRSQGFSSVPGLTSTIFNTGVATGTTNFPIGIIPAGAYIQQIIFSNSVAAAVTGGISIGSTASGTDVVAAQACGASCLTFTTDALTLKRVFSLTAPTTLHAAAVTAWNSANVTITVVYGYF